jgi:CheY-like chemotaxis protein
MPSQPPQTVAVLKANDDVVELLRIVFEQRGFAVVSTHVESVKRGEVDLASFVRQHRPAVVVYDIPPPYDRQWTFMNQLASMPGLTDIPFVVTTTNEKRLREIAGTDEQVLEIVDKPYDLDQIVQAVEAAIPGKR